MRPSCAVFILKIIIARKVQFLPPERQILEHFIYAKCYKPTNMHIWTWTCAKMRDFRRPKARWQLL